MVRGIENFREWFRGYEDQYVIIGGAACDLLMTEEGLDFRATKDIDLVLIIEAVNAAFSDNAITLPEDAVLSPLPMDEDVSSLSAILLDEDYYEFLRQGKIQISGVTVLSAPYLIPFKAKAWLDLSRRKSEGGQVDSRDIRKHKNDVFRLTELLDRNMSPLPYIPDAIRTDINEFTERMQSEEIDLKQIGIRDKSKEAILDELNAIYNNSGVHS